MGRNTISFCSIFLIGALFLDWGLFWPHVAADDGGVVRREGFEIIIGGGYSPPPEYEAECPPPPSPPPPSPPPPSPPPPSPPPPSPPPPSPPPPSPPPPSPPPPSPPPPSPPPPKPRPPVNRNARLQIALIAIRKLKPKIKKDPKGVLKTWVGNDPCKYKGFKCATVPKYKLPAVAGVDFNGFMFEGPDFALDGFINELPDITIFHANSNKFLRRIPKIDTNKLQYLYELDLSNNRLDGAFPYEVLAATQLTFLDLRFNSFSGVVPAHIFNLDVDVIFINNNNFLQQLPENLGDTPALYLTFANNYFTGPIPRSIGRSKNLLEVLFLNNQLSGCLPYEIGYLKDSTVFDVGFNQLTGPIPHSFGCLDKMELLNLAGNQFYGAVPETLCDLPNLSNLSLSYNYFTQVGPKCRKLIMKKRLDVKMNCILGLPQQKPESVCSHFFSTPRHCPDPKSFTKVPCGRYPSNRPSSAKPSSLRTYNSLIPHRL